MERRHFLLTSAAAGRPGRAVKASPNDTVRVACAGVRGQGREHIRRYGKIQNVEIAAICDIDESVLTSRLGGVEKMGRKRPAGYTDLRKLLEAKSIGAISIATPNRNHALQTIWACPSLFPRTRSLSRARACSGPERGFVACPISERRGLFATPWKALSRRPAPPSLVRTHRNATVYLDTGSACLLTLGSRAGQGSL